MTPSGSESTMRPENTITASPAAMTVSIAPISSPATTEDTRCRLRRSSDTVPPDRSNVSCHPLEHGAAVPANDSPSRPRRFRCDAPDAAGVAHVVNAGATSRLVLVLVVVRVLRRAVTLAVPLVLVSLVDEGRLRRRGDHLGERALLLERREELQHR